MNNPEDEQVLQYITAIASSYFMNQVPSPAREDAAQAFNQRLDYLQMRLNLCDERIKAGTGEME